MHGAHEVHCDREVTRLVPRVELERFVDARLGLGEGVEAHQVGDAFDVTDEVAALALPRMGRGDR